MDDMSHLSKSVEDISLERQRAEQFEQILREERTENIRREAARREHVRERSSSRRPTPVRSMVFKAKSREPVRPKKFVTAKTAKCLFCLKTGHFSSQCTKYEDHEQRKIRLDELNQCRICLAVHIIKEKCRNPKTCAFCHLRGKPDNHPQILCGVQYPTDPGPGNVAAAYH